MKKIRKQTSQLIKELIDLRNSRKSVDDFNFNFLMNFNDNCRLMHTHLSEGMASKELVKIAYRQYFVFLVSSWETFFRDIFVYIYTRDSASIDSLLQKMKITEDSLKLQDITLPELLSKSFNFQEISDLESAYNSLWGSNFLQYACKTETGACGLNGKATKGVSVSSLFPDWRKIIDTSFSIRHKVVHDANYRPEFDVNFIQKAEALFLMLPQLVTYFVAKRFGLKYIALSNGEYSVPNIFSIHDILADDWEVFE